FADSQKRKWFLNSVMGKSFSWSSVRHSVEVSSTADAKTLSGRSQFQVTISEEILALSGERGPGQPHANYENALNPNLRSSRLSLDGDKPVGRNHFVQAEAGHQRGGGPVGTSTRRIQRAQ